MAMRLKFKEIAQRQGIKNARQLAARSGINLTSCYQLWNGTAKAISFDALNTLCNVLQAGPALLLDYTPDVAAVGGVPSPAEQERKPERRTSVKAKRKTKQASPLRIVAVAG
jgi:DNA-binding Xre family transcriptional regulator